MSKVICDVCGTTYPETSAQCPICNSAKNSVDQTAAGSMEPGESGYAYVKGGRFSKKNVRKRNKKGGSTAQRRSSRNDQNEPSNTGLIIVVVLLLIAIAAVVIYIGVHFFGSNTDDNAKDSTTTAPVQTQEQTQQPTESTGGVSCQDLQLSNQIIEFTQEGETWTLVVKLDPADTTQGVSFVSSDETVASVSSDGVVTAVGGGEAVITVSCGEVSKTCSVTCSFGETEPSSEPTEPTVTGEFDFKWNTPYTDDSTGYGDATLSAQGKTWTAYKSSLEIDPSLITWTVDDESVCTVKDGIVTAVGSGKTLLHTTYNGVTYTCIIRCPFKTSESGSSSSGSSSNSGSCTISHTDVTLAVGSSFNLKLKDADGNTLNVTWSASSDGVSIDGNKITGVSAGKVTVSVTYEGETYSCIVRVTN